MCKTPIQRFNYNGNRPQLFPSKIFKILRKCSGWLLTKLFQQTNSRVGKIGNIAKKYYHKLCRCDVFIMISRHKIAWWFRKSRFKRIYEKAVLKDLVKFVWKHMCGGLFFSKDTGWISRISSNRDPGIVILLWVLRNSSERFFINIWE